ncbi:hypothetical protein CTA1_5309 [Colletotrichum tanaceti]|uniref:Uncharacterized protein n=1 Tax=Colletotrichum tanaceti TaxID=1306861 RepID=A0A4V6DFY4_9PEZI|nr:hypothetical protein CTA1_5309 [Colletotrichum tanaceti]
MGRAEVDLDVIHDELLANHLSQVHITKAFLLHLSKQGKQTALLFTTSQLGLTPMERRPNYNGSKAAMHDFILAIRAQLRDASSGVRVAEVYLPPGGADGAARREVGRTSPLLRYHTPGLWHAQKDSKKRWRWLDAPSILLNTVELICNDCVRR